VDEADSDVESLDALAAARAGQQSPLADVDEGDTADAVDLPGAELIGEEQPSALKKAINAVIA